MSSSINSPIYQSQNIQFCNTEREPANKVHILLVDDDDDLLYISRRFIEQFEGFIVDTVSSAKKGLERLRENSYDAIVSDYDMPELNGIAFFNKVRLEDNLTPFIIFSCKSREEIALHHSIPESIIFLQKQADLKQIFKELVSIIRLTIS